MSQRPICSRKQTVYQSGCEISLPPDSFLNLKTRPLLYLEAI